MADSTQDILEQAPALRAKARRARELGNMSGNAEARAALERYAVDLEAQAAAFEAGSPPVLPPVSISEKEGR